jgi:uncharacterized protein YdcH (DUF465 family)
MEKRDEKLIAALIKGDKTLREYMEQHNEYERQLKEYNKLIYLTSEESMERKRIQKLKLAGRDEIERILAEHRRTKKRQKA